MRIGHMNLPDALLDAQEKGSLVIFAGAGVSMGPPANLPSFKQLVEWIAGRSLRPEEGSAFDRILGGLADADTDVHQRAYMFLNDPNSRPNPLHYTLLKLFRSPEHVRVVTTNVDRHFSTVAGTVYGKTLPVYFAPALPRGDNFKGIVYLHGAVERDPDDFVLTDRDFAKAYITQRWAANFLQPMLDRYTVLFIGYSHSDPVVTYL